MAHIESNRNPLHRTLAMILATILLGSLVLGHATGCRQAHETKDHPANTSESQKFTRVIPQTVWEPFFFKDINKQATQANLPSLRAEALPGTDVEARIWYVLGYHGQDGFVLRRTSDQWSAMYLNGLSKKPNVPFLKQLGPPKSSWENVWNELLAGGLLELPDASQVDCNVGAKDGLGYVVETNANRTYRTFLYDNPAYATCNEAKKMLKLIEIINREFGTKWATT
jgi:hypothetical protein